MINWFRRLRARIRYRHFEHDLTEELEFHRQMKEEALAPDGAATGDAPWRAQRELGNTTLMREDARHVWIAPWLESVWQDMRYALRSLRKHPGFTVTATITLLLGIGLNTMLFTLFNALALRSWPVADPARVVRVTPLSRATRGRGDGISFAEYRFLQRRATSFSGLVALERSGARIAPQPSGQAEYVQACSVSGNFFDVLGVAMAAGRAFVPEEAVFGAPRAVTVIGDALWRRRFGADPTIVGRTVYINEQPFTIVGVASPRFTGPDSVRRYELFIPLPAMPLVRLQAHESDVFDNPERCCAEVAGRLAPGVSAPRATAEIASLLGRFRAEWKLRPIGVRLSSTANLGPLTSAESLDQPGSRRVLAVFSLLFVALFLVLLLACANVGNLQLARGMGRRREIAIRLAIGAGRRRIVRQLLTESLLLSLAAGGLSMGFAAVLLGPILRIMDPRANASLSVAPGLAVLAFTFVFCLLAVLLTGLAPALRATRPGPAIASPGWQEVGIGRVRLRSVLLATQIALTTILLVAAGLLTRGIVTAMSSDLGFAVNDILVAQVTPPAGSGDASLRSGWFRGVLDTLDEAGLGPIAVTNIAPLADSRMSVGVRLPGERESDARHVRMLSASPEYFDLLRIPLVAGRTYDPRPSAREVVVNETLARLLWPGQQAVGKTLISGATWTVVGVAKDTRITGFETVPPVLHWAASATSVPLILLRGGGPHTEARVRAALRTFDPRIAVSTAALSDSLRSSLRNSITGATIAWAIGLLGLALAVVGVFGVFAYVVEERRREIGIRLALGARGVQVVRLILAQTRTATLGGLAVGFILSLGAGQVLRAYLFGASPFDPIAYGGIALLLAVSAAVAAYVPARRASRIDPAVTLRCE
jgi:predicted permease